MLKSLVATLAVAAGLLVPTGTASAAPAPDLVVPASGDAYVSEPAPTVAEGTADPGNCFVNDETTTRKRCLVGFTVTGLGVGDTVTGAELRIVDKGDATGSKLVNLSPVASFNESAVTWSTAPSVPAAISSDSTHAFKQDSVFPLPAGTITGNGSYSFALWSPPNVYATAMNFFTKENTAGQAPPRLVLHVDHVDRNTAVFGSNVHQRTGETFDEALARQDAEYAPKAMRLFFSGLPSTSCTESRNALANERPSIVSFKTNDAAGLAAGTYDATINAWLACFTRQTRVTYYHEPEDNFTTATAKANYRAAWQHFSALVLAHPNRANLLREIIYGDFTWLPSANRNPLDWYPGDAYVDVIGADQYGFNENNASSTDDQTEAQHLAVRPSLAFAVSHGKQYDVPELGYDDPATRPAFLRDLGAYLKDPSRNVGIVTYFDGGSDTVNGGAGNHQMLDAASQQAWRDVIAS